MFYLILAMYSAILLSFLIGNAQLSDVIVKEQLPQKEPNNEDLNKQIDGIYKFSIQLLRVIFYLHSKRQNII